MRDLGIFVHDQVQRGTVAAEQCGCGREKVERGGKMGGGDVDGDDEDTGRSAGDNTMKHFAV